MVPQTGGLMPDEEMMGAEPSAPLSANPEYDELVGDNPGLGPVGANEEPTETEMMHFNEILADFLEHLYGKGEDPVVRMLKSAKELYQGVAKAAFILLKSTHEKYEQKEGPVDPAILFGEGGMISTAVDEVFKVAQAIRHPAAQDMNQYSAAQLEVMRLVGDHIEKSQDDGAVGEAQDVLIDMEMEAGGGEGAAPLDYEESGILREAAAPPVTKEEMPMDPNVPADPNVPMDPSMMQQPPQAAPQGLV